jgi:23S rRNA (cytosine1962-C5)-methyltransferase
LKHIFLKKNKEQFIYRQHPYIFSGAIAHQEEGIEIGDVVEVKNKQGEFLAIAHFHPGSLALRVLSFQPIEINDEFWLKKISKAYHLRKSNQEQLLEETNCFRLVHGEGDFLPGLIIDIYDTTAVIQCHTIGMLRQVSTITKTLIQVIGDSLTHIYHKSADVISKEYMVENEYLYGDDSAIDIIAKEHGLSYQVDIKDGQKTGFFLDQRQSRKIIQSYVKGKSVLNTFCYTGGFSISALAAGARSVHSVDQSKSALAILNNNIALNNFQDKDHQSSAMDVLAFLKENSQKYDVIVVDPPAYTKSKARRHKAVQAYKRLNAEAIRHIKPNGIIFTFSCSQAVDAPLFYNTIQAAAIETGRQIRILNILQQPFDHPVSIYCQEKRYLKGLVISVD